KIIALAKRYSRVIFQDDNIKSWKEGWFGKQVQYSGIGGITERIKNILSTPISVIDRYQTTSKICFSCGSRVELSLSDRIFRCPVCGYEEDRDINSARNMLQIALDRVEEKWLTLTEKEIGLIERLFSNVKKYVKILLTSSGMRDVNIAYPTVGLTGSYALGKGSSSFQ
ncbi:MAG: zinc ribbon domain-containing protein, partial [Candidatus Aenigmatarchaeota archaeon]